LRHRTRALRIFFRLASRRERLRGRIRSCCIVRVGYQADQSDLQDAGRSLARQERNITPGISANEIYDILRERLFKNPSDKNEMTHRQVYGSGRRSARSRLPPGAKPSPMKSQRLIHFIHAQKCNPCLKKRSSSKQGLIELVSRLLRSVGSGRPTDVFPDWTRTLRSLIRGSR